ncbi:MAG: hypothetical protein ACHQ1D_12935, partial [Nitrososphaerales archaeon]
VSSKKFVVKISISVDTLKNKHKLIEHIFILFNSEYQEVFPRNFNESSGLNRLKKISVLCAHRMLYGADTERI